MVFEGSRKRGARDSGSQGPLAAPMHVSAANSIVIDELTDRAPLLPTLPDDEDLPDQNDTRRYGRSHAMSTGLMFAMVLLVSYAGQIITYPQVRILESVICYGYYEQHDRSKLNFGRDIHSPGAIGGVDEMYCKVNAVQDQLYTLVAYAQVFDCIPGLLLTIPFGWAADRYGRWPFTFMWLVSTTISAAYIQFILWNWQLFDIRLVWLSSIQGLFGGGTMSFSALCFVILSDITPDTDRAATFFRLGAVNISASVFMPVLDAWLMTIDPWIPSLIGVGLFALGSLVWLFMPETKGSHKAIPTTSADAPDSDDEDILRDFTGDEGRVSRWTVTTRTVSSIARSLYFLLEDWRIFALIVPFVGHSVISASPNLLLQYISKHYEIVMAQATLIITIQNGFTVVLLTLVLPWLSTRLVQAYGLSSLRKDMVLARLSYLLRIAGWTVVGLAPNVPILIIGLAISSMGAADTLILRSCITALVPSHHIARAYSVIGILDVLGMMGGAQLMKVVFKQGLAMGGIWLGLPFIVIALSTIIFAVFVFSVPLRDD